MRTAEELDAKSQLTINKNERLYRLAIYKECQLDAMKEGMCRAANKIGAEDETNDCSACRRQLKDVEQAILTAAEQLTEKDL